VIPDSPIIVCVSANPALDRRVHLSRLAIGEVNRARSAVMMPGGKSAHVAMVARALGARSVWVGFSGGSTGAENESGLTRLGIEVHAVRTASATRVNLEAIDDSGNITELLEPGGTVDIREQQEILRVCEENLRGNWNGAAVVISGSLPPGVTPEFYVSVIRVARAFGSKVFLDASGDALRESVAARPDFVKPNQKEAGQVLGTAVVGERETAEAAARLIDSGAASAAITMGANGLIWKESKAGACWVATPPKVKPISTVGCGDATMAGFAYADLTGLKGEDAVRLAAACGTANCFAELSGQISKAEVDRLMPQIETRLVEE
jgi:1-phosphofructokinase family hexose kinase